MIRYRTPFVLLLSIACLWAFSWFIWRSELVQSQPATAHQVPISRFWEKHQYWSPSAHLGTDTDKLESMLSHQVERFSGNIVKSSQGMSDARLRQASPDTFATVARLIDSSDRSLQLAASRLLCLYLESVSGSENLDPDSVRKRKCFCELYRDKVKKLLQDNDPDIRSAAALAAGNLDFNRDIKTSLDESFQRERSATGKIHLAWAHFWLLKSRLDE